MQCRLDSRYILRNRGLPEPCYTNISLAQGLLLLATVVVCNVLANTKLMSYDFHSNVANYNLGCRLAYLAV